MLTVKESLKYPLSIKNNNLMLLKDTWACVIVSISFSLTDSILTW